MNPVTVVATVVAVCALLVATITTTLVVGRALDDSARQYVTFTRDGATFTCERITDIAGRTFYDSCERVP